MSNPDYKTLYRREISWPGNDLLRPVIKSEEQHGRTHILICPEEWVMRVKRWGPRGKPKEAGWEEVLEKGLDFPPQLLPDVLAALKAAEMRVEDKSLLPPDGH